MDMISKVAIGLGGLGVAVVTGAAIQSSINEREKLRDKIYDLENKNKQMAFDIDVIKRSDDRQNERINDVNSRVHKIEMKQAVEKA